MANEFAKSLARKEQAWQEADWIKYKALLSVTGRPSLQDAIQLMHGLDDYDLRPDVAATWDYAEVILREKYPDLPEELFQTPQAAMVGRQMLEENHAAITDYGLLRRKDSGQLPVFRQEQKEAQARLRKRQNELKKTEERIGELEDRDSEIDTLMIQEDIFTNSVKCQELAKEKAAIAEELEELYMKWEELAEDA